MTDHTPENQGDLENSKGNCTTGACGLSKCSPCIFMWGALLVYVLISIFI